MNPTPINVLAPPLYATFEELRANFVASVPRGNYEWRPPIAVPTAELIQWPSQRVASQYFATVFGVDPDINCLADAVHFINQSRARRYFDWRYGSPKHTGANQSRPDGLEPSSGNFSHPQPSAL